MKKLVASFTIIPANGEEKINGDLTPDELVVALAKQKAEEIAALPQANEKAVLGADTLVVLDGRILGKPKDETDAVRMLSALSGRSHEVYTGVYISYPEKGGRKTLCGAACTKVYFYQLTQEKISAYAQSGSPMDKAGAYGIQDGDLVEKIEGSFSNVVGLPLELCEELIRKTGF